MARRQLKSDDEVGFIRAYRDDLADTEAMYHVIIRCELVRPLHGTGLEIRMTAHKRGQESSEAPWCEARYLYPTHSANTLYAALYRAAIGIGAAISNRRRDETGDWLRATNVDRSDSD